MIGRGVAPGQPASARPGDDAAADARIAGKVKVIGVRRRVHRAVGAEPYRRVVSVRESTLGAIGHSCHVDRPPAPSVVEADTRHDGVHVILLPQGDNVR